MLDIGFLSDKNLVSVIRKASEKKYRYESRESRKNNRTNERHDLTKLIIMHRFFEKSEVAKGLNIHRLKKNRLGYIETGNDSNRDSLDF